MTMAKGKWSQKTFVFWNYCTQKKAKTEIQNHLAVDEDTLAVKTCMTWR